MRAKLQLLQSMQYPLDKTGVNLGIMEIQMENLDKTGVNLGIMENQMENNMDNDMGTGVILKGLGCRVRGVFCNGFFFSSAQRKTCLGQV